MGAGGAANEYSLSYGTPGNLAAASSLDNYFGNLGNGLTNTNIWNNSENNPFNPPKARDKNSLVCTVGDKADFQQKPPKRPSENCWGTTTIMLKG